MKTILNYLKLLYNWFLHVLLKRRMIHKVQMSSLYGSMKTATGTEQAVKVKHIFGKPKHPLHASHFGTFSPVKPFKKGRAQ